MSLNAAKNYAAKKMLQLINGAQFLNITPLSFSSPCLAAAPFPAPIIVILLLKSMYASP